ncbi:hypothetical protein [Ruegeria sp. THAF33]|uniref:hypothetical protein n=1 Tax=Ruegeria sp. THAF33 TaxID=2587853 RepID=UPI001267E9DA|nr:hypothetical protein [Ruegeria sp. THAF33]QFT74939.1 hypothetical protein FIU92_18015 [Ruegeria sp. THAF33]
MTKNIDIERRFAPTEENQLSDPDYLSYLGDQPHGVKTWLDLLQASPIVVLGEGRIGKTFEFVSQVESLKSQTEFAFFVPLERLHDENLDEALDPKEVQLFHAWKNSANSVGYFFLDALDELKLREGTLRKALKKLQDAVEPHFGRVNVILSCRPADWKTTIDQQSLKAFCVSGNESRPEVIADPEAAFLAVVSREEANAEEKDPAETEFGGVDRSQVNIVSILPLSKNEVRDFAKLYSTECAEEFCNHLESNDIWHLHRLPAEIMDTLDQLQAGQPLGQLEEQVRFGIQEKLGETEENKRRSLSLDKAVAGAERIALALFLLKRRSLKTEKNNDPETLDVNDVLTDWQPHEQEELIGKALFDPSGVGAVRFHHRSSQEYLAARRLLHLREQGMPIREFFELLFSNIGGEQVVKPSMAPITAWLSLWLPDVRQQVLDLEPTLLFRQGLPSALPLDLKAEILRAYVKQYSNKDWCRTGVDAENLRRIADSNLAPVVRELWVEGYTGHDSREILLDFIYAAPISECADLALDAALDSEIGPVHQTYGAWGVLDGGTDEQKQVLANALLQGHMSERITRNILPRLVPQHISIDEAFAHIESMEEIPNSVHGLNYTLYQISKNAEVSRSDQISLRSHLADAIWQTRRADCRMYQAHSEKDHYQDGLIAACAASIPTTGENSQVWARAVAIAMHFGERRESIIAKEETKAVWVALGENPVLRASLFWACLEMADELEGHEDDWPRFIRSISESRRSTRLDDSDLEWLLPTLENDAPENQRGVAFEAVKYFFDLRNNADLARSVSQRIQDKPAWCETLHQILNPQPREPDEFELEMQAREAEHEQEETKRVKDWVEWRSEVLADPDFLMDGDRRIGVLFDAHKVIEQGMERDSHWGLWDSHLIASTFSEQFLERYRAELSKYWRETEVLLPSEREASERNAIYDKYLLALAAVKAETEVSGWEYRLTHEEAIQASRIACLELNGFGSYYFELDRAHPDAMAQVIAQESLAQLNQLNETGRADMFHDIFYHGTDNMKSAFAAHVAPQLGARPLGDIQGLRDAIDYAVRIISTHGSEEERQIVTNTLQSGLPGEEDWPSGFKISLLATLNPEIGCQALLDETCNLDDNSQRSEAVAIFASVFGDRHDRRMPNLNSIPVERRVPVLRDLILRAYQAVRRDEDVRHDGVYSPGVRDNAQDARSFLFDTLLEVKHPAVLSVLHELAERPEFSHMPDRLRQMSYEIATQISDDTPYPLVSFQALDRESAFIPYDNRSLFTAMMGRLDAFEHDILHAEDRPIEALRLLDQETGLRSFISNWLRGRDRGVFDFTQEAVVADENRTDLRLHPKSLQGYATVELKRETWSISEFETALHDQLVGQYLQHERCQVGCLLICQRAQKQWRNPEGGQMWGLEEVVIHLQTQANELMSQYPELHLSVKGIDYS